MTHILYGAPLSLYSGKARAYLDWKGVDYREELARPEVYRDVIIPNVGRPVIPVVRTADGEILQDTTLIIDHFEAAEPEPSIYPSGPRQRLAALLLETYGDEWLVIPAMHYRWNYHDEWIFTEFGKVAAPDGTPAEQLEIGRKRGATFKGFVPALGVNETTIPAIEASYEALLGDLDRHFQQYDFLFGSRPSIGDFGLIGPLYAHLYRDPASGELMKRLAPHVARWVERMVEVREPRSGRFLADDVVPETLLPVLRRMMSEQLPFLQSVALAFDAWTAEHPGEPTPRSVGFLPFTVSGVTAQRMAPPFSLWMLQRPLDHYMGLAGADRAAADALLDAAGGEAFRDFRLPRRVRFANHVVSAAD